MGEHRQKLYCDTYAIFLVKATKKLTGNTHFEPEFRAGEDFFVSPSGDIVKIVMLPLL